MNENEEVTYNWLKKKGIEAEKIDSIMGLPDFEAEEEYYEVKTEDNYMCRLLSPLQKKIFPKLNKPVFIIFIKNKRVIRYEKYDPKVHDSYKGIVIGIDFEEEDFEKLKTLKGSLTWKEYILKIAGIKK